MSFCETGQMLEYNLTNDMKPNNNTSSGTAYDFTMS